MAVRKIAISVPGNILGQIDRMAKQAGSTRSGFISRVLEEVSHARTQAEITERINALFDDGSLAKEQLATSRGFLRAAEPNEDGQEW